VENDKVSCRICANQEGWKRPDGLDKSESAGSYVSINGFGHEEWLFNFTQTIDSVKYGFLQPINRNFDNYAGMTFDVSLYTIQLSNRYFMGEIVNCRVLDTNECLTVQQNLRSTGILKSMAEDVERIGGNPKLITEASAAELVNVAFSPDAVRFFEPARPVPRSHKASLASRYQLLYEGAPAAPQREAAARPFAKNLSLRHRPAIEPVEYDPLHDKLQRALVEALRREHGYEAVAHEDHHVDVVLRLPTSTVFFEVKGANTARSCLRQAIGQLLEYSHWPEARDADRLVVVGWPELDEDGKDYLVGIRRRYELPLYYRTLGRETGALGPEH